MKKTLDHIDTWLKIFFSYLNKHAIQARLFFGGIGFGFFVGIVIYCTVMAFFLAPPLVDLIKSYYKCR